MTPCWPSIWPNTGKWPSSAARARSARPPPAGITPTPMSTGTTSTTARQILAGPANLVERFGLDRLSKTIPVALFDELHKYPRWKQFLKGFFDTYADQVRIIVTGSSRMDVYRRGGDSLMGRYFLYRMHPFSVAETLHQDLPDPKRIVRPPREDQGSRFRCPLASWRLSGAIPQARHAIQPPLAIAAPRAVRPGRHPRPDADPANRPDGDVGQAPGQSLGTPAHLRQSGEGGPRVRRYGSPMDRCPAQSSSRFPDQAVVSRTSHGPCERSPSGS